MLKFSTNTRFYTDFITEFLSVLRCFVNLCRGIGLQNPGLSDDLNRLNQPPAATIRLQLERICTSPHLQASEKRIAFLKFIVEESLADRADKLKGYTVAVAVFGRDETFDAQSDPVVRLEARRLRRDLDSYYANAGSHDPVRISIPKGSYVPRFEWLNEGTPETTSLDHLQQLSPNSLAARENDTTFSSDEHHFGWLSKSKFAAILLISSMLVFLGWKLLNPTASSAIKAAGYAIEPSVLVLPFEALGNTEYSQSLAAGVSHELIANLMKFPGFRLYTLPGNKVINNAVQPGSKGWAPDQTTDATYIIRGSVRDSAMSVQLAVELLFAETGEVLLAEIFDRPLTPADLSEVQRELAGAIASRIGQPYGVISENLNRRLSNVAVSDAVSDMHSYVCVLRAFSYRRNFTQQEHGPVLECLQQAVQRDPQYSDAWAMLGWLHLDAGRFGFSGPENLTKEYDLAYEAASRAVALEPNNTLALKALSSVNHYLGRFAESEALARKALELNPYDPDTLAQLGWRLAARGNFTEGITLLEQAINRTASPPGWYFTLITINDYLSGNFENMLAHAQRSVVEGGSFGQALIAIANTKLGRREEARTALIELEKFELMADDPEGYLRRSGATDEIVDAMVTGLEEARQYTNL